MKQPIALRIETALLEQVRRCAAEENRTLTNFIETVLRTRVAKQNAPPAHTQGPGKEPVTAGKGAPAAGRKTVRSYD